MKKFFEKFGCGMEQTIQQVKEDKERLEEIEKQIKARITNAVYAESQLNTFCCSEKIIQELNALLCRVANEKGITLYQLCASVIPHISYNFEKSEFVIELIPKV